MTTEHIYFFEANYKYLNKDDIGDLYSLYLNGKDSFLGNSLLHSLVVFIRSCVIRERVHDYQLGIKSYQIKINLTAPTLTLTGIENLELYYVITEPFVEIIYDNNKKEKRVMGIREIPKFCDATLEKVMKEVSMIVFEARYKLKNLPLSKLDKDILDIFEK
ncbi:hypothetical protein Tco_0222971 [Tanacetum coccineum]